MFLKLTGYNCRDGRLVTLTLTGGIFNVGTYCYNEKNYYGKI